MALQAIVSKKSVSYVQPKLHNIIFNLILKEDTVEVLNKDFNCQFAQGDNVASKTAKMIEEMQNEIANYKSAKAIFDSTPLNNAVATIQGGLVC
jgi:hypothetical protein